MSEILIIVLCYNEQDTIEKVIKNLTKIQSHEKLDILIIDDGSEDNSQEIIKKNRIRFIKNDQNIGIAKSLTIGYEWAIRNNYKYLIQFDGDGQHNAEDIPSLIKNKKDKTDLVIGSRYLNQNYNYNLKGLGSIVISKLIDISFDKKIKDPTSGLRIMNVKILKYLVNEDYSYAMEPLTICITLKNKFSVKEIPVRMNERYFGKSSINNFNGAKYMIYFIFKLAKIIFNVKKNYK